MLRLYVVKKYYAIILSTGPPIITAVAIIPPGSVMLNSTVTLACSVLSGNLPLNYTWTDPYGSIIATDNPTQIRVSTHLEYGTYMCSVANSLGMDNATIDVMRVGMIQCEVL